VDKVTIFIANGAVAGQQSNHFLFHIIPRENGDGLDNFSIKGSEKLLSEQEKILPQLRNNMTAIMLNHLKKEGKQFPKKEQKTSQEQKNKPQEKEFTKEEKEALLEKKKEQLAQFIESQPLVRKLLIEDPEEFKRQLSETPQLQPLFQGVDIDLFSKQLSELENKGVLVKEEEQGVLPETKNGGVTEQKEESLDKNETRINNNPIMSYTKQSEKTEEVNSHKETKPEVFLGENPLKQREIVFKYFEEKPKAKELLKEDPDHFKQLLSKRPDVQKIFEQVNLDKLSEKLKELEAGLGGDSDD